MPQRKGRARSRIISIMFRKDAIGIRIAAVMKIINGDRCGKK